MALTPSRMPPLGMKAPNFSLPDTEGNSVSLKNALGPKGLLVVFLCNHCPYVKHIRTPLAALTKRALEAGVGVVGINSNDADKYPDDSPEKMALEKKQWGYPFAYLFDATQEVARAYQAACTPDFYLFDAKGALVYRGQFDDSRPGNGIPPTGKDLQRAIDDLTAGRAPNIDQRPSVGCNIKWKA